MLSQEPSAFLRILGDNPRLRILEYFIEGRELDHAKQDVVDSTGLSRSTVYNEWEDLLREGLIVQSRTAGKTRLYRINIESSIVQQFITLFDAVIDSELRKMAGTTQKPVTTRTANTTEYQPTSFFSRTIVKKSQCPECTPPTPRPHQIIYAA